MRRFFKNLGSFGAFLAPLPLILAGCNAEHESSIGKFARDANFPMYFIAGGETPESGSLHKISEVSRGQTVSSEEILTGLTAPSRLIQDSAGNIYITEMLPYPDGKIKRIKVGQDVATDFIVDLDYPTGVAVDTFNQLYVLENGKKRITRFTATGDFEAFKEDEIGSPEVGTMDFVDNIFLLESDPDLVSKIYQDGTREVLSPDLDGVIDMAIDASGVIHVLFVDVVDGTGKVMKITSTETTEDVVIDLINPTAIAFDGSNALYISEGAPENRITRYAAGESVRRVVVKTDVEPNAIIFTPF